MNRVKLRSRRDVGPGILAAVGLLLFLVPGAPLGTHAAQAPPPPAGRPHVDPAAEVVGSGMTPPRAPLIAGGWVNRTAQLGVAPSARFGAMSAYDAADGALLLFGGTGVGHQVLRDTWTYVDGVWHNITNLAGTAPSARTDGTMAYDSADAEVVLYGGIHLGTYQSDTWAFKGGQWSSVSTNTSAGPVADAAMSFDPTVEALVLFGGSPHPGTAVRNTTFTFAKGVWKNISSTVASTPPGVTRASMTWDGRLNATLLFGGTGPKQPINQTWAFSLGHWRRLTAPNDVAPPARDSAGFAYDAADGYDVLFGGNAAGFALNDTWAFRSGNWSLLPEGVIPPGRSLGALVYTPGPGPLNASIVLFGGRSSPLANATVDGDTWTYKLPLQATINLSAAMIDVSHTL
ncbi:MAG TPA: hypothetical protein VLY85_05040, partial [Thermoplasmata archaeon]|nr:hypothetical protein [Thermoplasmata archaeon]